MYLVAIAWMYVVLMMTLAEATSPNGTVLGAFFTFLLYGALPLSVVLYVMGSPARRKARLAAEAEAQATAPALAETGASAAGPGDPDGSGHAPGDPVTPERKEP